MLESLVVTIDMYRRAFARGAWLAARNWPVLASVFAYVAILTVGGYLAMFLGPASGLAMSLLISACLGSFLYLVEMMVRTTRVSWEDFRRSFGMYLWDVVAVNFALWIFWRLAMPLLHQMAHGQVVVLCVELLILIFFNPVPELIYLGHYSLLQLLARSYEFTVNNWVEWFPPNLLLAVAVGCAWLPFSGGPLAEAARLATTSLVVYFAMVVRGLLFVELDGSTRRSRIFRHKMGR